MEINNYLDKVSKTSYELKKQGDVLKNIIEVLKEAKKNNHQVFICGNGGSAGTATHMAADLFKIAKLKAISLNENTPLTTAIINDEGWEYLYTSQLQRLFVPGDILIAFSVHGGAGEDEAGPWSQNLNRAIAYVKRNNGKTICFSGFDGGQMKYACENCIVIPADSTPLVEAFHVVLHHLIAFMLQEGERI